MAANCDCKNPIELTCTKQLWINCSLASSTWKVASLYHRAVTQARKLPANIPLQQNKINCHHDQTQHFDSLVKTDSSLILLLYLDTIYWDKLLFWHARVSVHTIICWD